MIRRFGVLVVPLVVLLAYAQTLDAPFVWDDRHVVIESAEVRELRPLSEYFGKAFWVSPETGDHRAYYRPLTVLSFAVDHWLHGPNPAGFHLTNVLLHAVNALLVYLLLRRFRVRPCLAACLVWLWALHPRLTEAVAWVSGRTDVLATTFVLAALLLHRPHRLSRLFAASALVVCGMLAKEVALVGFVALAVLEWSPRRRGSGVSSSRRGLVLSLAVPLLLPMSYLALRLHALGGVPTSVLEVQLGPAHRVKLALAAVGHYVRMLLLPWNPELQIGDVLHPEPAVVLFGCGSLVALAAVGYRLRVHWLSAAQPRRTLAKVGASFVLAGVGLVLHLVPISVGVVAADRFLYVPLVGMAIFAGSCLSAWRPMRGAGAALGLVLASFLVATVVRGRAWADEGELWRQAYHATPKANPLPATELGNVYFRAGLYEEAAAIFALAAQDGRHSSVARGNLGVALGQLGLYPAARGHLRRLCAEQQRIAKFCLDAALIELHSLNFEPAITLAELARSRAGEYPDASAVLEQIPRVRALAQHPALQSPEPAVRQLAQFRLAHLAGRRSEALELGRRLLLEPATPQDVRRQAAEYWTRFGPPDQLGQVVHRNGPSADVLDDALLDAAAMRLQTAQRLRTMWTTLGIPEHKLE
ncbi:MAG: hypothetical protein IT377_23345 [Polyangiaceae bacterium]|nr:hypothetical protein [Polyangiaceae bacterium]